MLCIVLELRRGDPISRLARHLLPCYLISSQKYLPRLCVDNLVIEIPKEKHQRPVRSRKPRESWELSEWETPTYFLSGQWNIFALGENNKLTRQHTPSRTTQYSRTQPPLSGQLEALRAALASSVSRAPTVRMPHKALQDVFASIPAGS
jgi:hypothetical protein